MRAKPVNFERGQEPLDSLKIGRVKERFIAKKHDEIAEAILKLATEHGADSIQDKSGKDRISIGFTHYKDYVYISLDIDDPEANEYTVGWHKTENLSITGNGDEMYYNTLEDCIDQLKNWIG